MSPGSGLIRTNSSLVSPINPEGRGWLAPRPRHDQIDDDRQVIRADVSLDVAIEHSDRARRQQMIDRYPHDHRCRGEAGLDAKPDAAVA